MPYSSVKELPPEVKKALPSEAQTIWRKAFNSALRQYGDEQRAFQVAWAAVKHAGYSKDGEKWSKSEKASWEEKMHLLVDQYWTRKGSITLKTKKRKLGLRAKFVETSEEAYKGMALHNGFKEIDALVFPNTQGAAFHNTGIDHRVLLAGFSRDGSLVEQHLMEAHSRAHYLLSTRSVLAIELSEQFYPLDEDTTLEDEEL